MNFTDFAKRCPSFVLRQEHCQPYCLLHDTECRQAICVPYFAARRAAKRSQAILILAIGAVLFDIIYIALALGSKTF